MEQADGQADQVKASANAERTIWLSSASPWRACWAADSCSTAASGASARPCNPVRTRRNSPTRCRSRTTRTRRTCSCSAIWSGSSPPRPPPWCSTATTARTGWRRWCRCRTARRSRRPCAGRSPAPVWRCGPAGRTARAAAGWACSRARCARPCPGASSCVPLVVGGKVIGSVLLSRPTPYDEADEQRIRESVSQAAPVLANLRNLAIAEIRAATDGLTGLPNKRAVTDALKRMFAQAATERSPLALLMLDLDHFKQVNDQRGHAVGDQVLANVGAVMRGAMRSQGLRRPQRGGGVRDPAPRHRDPGGAAHRRAGPRGDRRDVPAGHRVAVTVSVGVAGYPEHASTRTGSRGWPTRPSTSPSGRAGTASSWPSPRSSSALRRRPRAGGPPRRLPEPRSGGTRPGPRGNGQGSRGTGPGSTETGRRPAWSGPAIAGTAMPVA